MPGSLIDVLIPAFNAAKTIRSALESIQEQTVKDIRILVIDDGSTDQTRAISLEMAGTDPRIEVLTKANGGIVDALNFGLTRCDAPYLARHDADDIAYPDRFARQIDYLQASPDCVGCGGSVRLIDEEGGSVGNIVRPGSPELSDANMAPAREPYIIHPFLMARTAAIHQAGGYRYVFHAEDTDLYWRLQEGGRLHNLPDILGDYRMHSGSVSSSSLRNGRVAALNSQLSSISACRRRGNLPDLAFPKEALEECNAAGTLMEIFRIGSRGLAPAEVGHLELALSAKILELTSYRPFELDMEDCRFIRRAIQKHMNSVTVENRAMLRRMCNGAAVRMIMQGSYQRANELVWPGLYPGVVLRLGFRLMTPSALRRHILRLSGRATFFK